MTKLLINLFLLMKRVVVNFRYSGSDFLFFLTHRVYLFVVKRKGNLCPVAGYPLSLLGMIENNVVNLSVG